MLKSNQHGSLISILLLVIFVILIFTISSDMIFRNTDSGDDGQTAETNSPVDQARDAADGVNEAGERANTILNGLTGN